MELLIPGLILVALMVYASTRIKRSAAAAFEAETIETDEFVIQKPDGFLNVIGGDPQFEAYSKEFGGLDQNIRLATARLMVSSGSSVDGAVSAIRESGVEIVADVGEVIGERHYRVIESKLVDNGVGFRVFDKLAESGGKLYDLEVTVFAEAPEDFLNKAEAMLTSFELK